MLFLITRSRCSQDVSKGKARSTYLRSASILSWRHGWFALLLRFVLRDIELYVLLTIVSQTETNEGLPSFEEYLESTKKYVIFIIHGVHFIRSNSVTATDKARIRRSFWSIHWAWTHCHSTRIRYICLLFSPSVSLRYYCSPVRAQRTDRISPPATF